MKPLQFKIITDPEEAKKLWEYFSPHKTLDDEWNFRDTWRKQYDLPFHFIVGYDGEKPIGLLPLQFNALKGLSPVKLQMTEPYLEFFGGIDTDDNKVFLLPGYEDHLAAFLEQIKKPACLSSLHKEYTVGKKTAEFYLNRFTVDLTGITSFDEYIDLHFTGKTRRNIKHELRRNKMEDYIVTIKTGSEDDLALMFSLSQERFGERSSFHREDRQQLFKNLYKNFNADVFVILLNNEPKAVVFGIVYKKTYIGLNIGYDYTVPNMGKFIFTSTISRAVQMGCTIYDVGQGDNGWKSRLHLNPVPQYILRLNLAK